MHILPVNKKMYLETNILITLYPQDYDYPNLNLSSVKEQWDQTR